MKLELELHDKSSFRDLDLKKNHIPSVGKTVPKVTLSYAPGEMVNFKNLSGREVGHFY